MSASITAAIKPTSARRPFFYWHTVDLQLDSRTGRGRLGGAGNARVSNLPSRSPRQWQAQTMALPSPSPAALRPPYRIASEGPSATRQPPKIELMPASNNTDAFISGGHSRHLPPPVNTSKRCVPLLKGASAEVIIVPGPSPQIRARRLGATVGPRKAGAE